MKSVWLLLFFVFFWLPSVGNADAQVKVDGEVVSFDVKEGDLLSVLKDMEGKTGVKITIRNEDLVPRKVTIRFDGKLEDAVKAIFQTNYAIVYQFGKIKEIIILPAGLPDSGYIRTVDLEYGDMVSKNAMFGQGPESFAVDKNGNIYILDSLRSRIQVFSNHGAFLFTIPLTKEPRDIAISPESGAILVLSRDMYLFQYNESGQVVKTIPVADRWHSAGAMYIGGDKIFLAVHSPSEGYVVIGRFVGGKIMVPTIGQLQRGVEDTFWGVKKKYRISNFQFRIGADVEVLNETGDITIYHFDKVLSIQLLGEDEGGIFYVATEKRDENGILVAEVHKLENGTVSTVKMIPSSIDTWSIKHYDVIRETLTEFVPERERLRLNFYRVNP